MGGHGMDYKAQDRDVWRSVVSKITILLFPYNIGVFVTS